MAASEESLAETSSPEGPASLREALQEAYQESVAESEPAPAVNDPEPTSDEPQLATSEQHEAEESPSEEPVSQGEEPEVIQAPEHWSDEDKATFTELPSAAREYLLKREKQYEQGIQKKSEELKPIDEAFSAYDDALRLRGIDRTTAIRSWIAAQQALDQDPVTGFKMLIETYGPDVQERIRAQFGQTDEYQYDDENVTKLRTELNETRQHSRQIEQQYQQLRQQEAIEQIRQFKEATDDSGKPLHPFFDDVQDKMQALISSGVANDLESAYEQAVWMVPSYREEFTKSQVETARKEEAKKRAEAAEKAKKTAKTVSGKASKPPAKVKPTTIADDLRNAWNDSIKGDL